MRTRTKKSKRPKLVAYELIPEHSDVGRPMYDLLERIVVRHHDELAQAGARIAIAWCTSWKPDADGRLTLGKCKKASELDRELAPFDFVVLLNRDWWQDLRVTALQREALLDHELHHAAIAYDENGEPKIDNRGRTIFRIRKHDLEEFAAVAERYGCYKRDLEQFAQALARADRRGGTWVGYSGLRDVLTLVGLDVPLEVIAHWSESERRDVLTWAQLRQEADVRHVNPALSPSMPACLAEAVRPQDPEPPASAVDHTTH